MAEMAGMARMPGMAMMARMPGMAMMARMARMAEIYPGLHVLLGRWSAGSCA
jgi:hypothetical protein